MEINGFEIAERNIHGLKDGKTEQICPKCSHTRSAKNQKAKCASADWDRGLLTCHHCGEITQIHTFKRKSPEKVYSKPAPRAISAIDQKVADWFKGRGISLKTLEKAGVTTSPGWIEFNYFSGGELINRKSRNGQKQFRLEKGCELTWYNFDALLTNTDIIICEGEIDALSFMECGFDNCISVPNGAANFTFLDNSIDHFDGIEKIYLSCDNDEAGQKLQNELIRRLGAEKILLVELAGAKDANEYLSLHGVDKLRTAVVQAPNLPLEHVKQLRDVEEEFENAIKNGFEKGLTCGLENIDNVFSIVDHQFCVVTGIPSHGKSDFVDHYCMGLNERYGWKIAYASPENYPIHYHTHKLFRKIYNGMPTKEDIGTERYIKARDVLDESYYFIDLYDFSLENVLKKAAELVKRKGIKALVIDPFNKIKLKANAKDSINDYTNAYLNAIDQFCRKYNVFVFLIAHPIKLMKKDDGTYPCPSFYDVKGGGEMYDMSPNGLAVHRDFNAGTTMVKVLKVKFQFQGDNNAEAHFTWNQSSGRYEPIERNIDLPWDD